MKKLCPRCDRIVTLDALRNLAQCPCGWYGTCDSTLSEPRLPLVPPLPYVSIDLETTGLNAETCQILEFGAVFDDWTRPLADMPRFHRYIAHDIIVGEPFAIQMNAAIIKKIANRMKNDPGFCTINELASQFERWLRGVCGWDTSEHITPAGKNFASFDMNFLKPKGFGDFFHRRTLDPAVLYWYPTEDKKLPDTKTCMLRAGLDGEVAHTAVEDALTVVHLIRRGMKRLATN
jgi:DNA polymerase III epsilon subunit-like protein